MTRVLPGTSYLLPVHFATGKSLEIEAGEEMNYLQMNWEMPKTFVLLFWGTENHSSRSKLCCQLPFEGVETLRASWTLLLLTYTIAMLYNCKTRVHLQLQFNIMYCFCTPQYQTVQLNCCPISGPHKICNYKNIYLAPHNGHCHATVNHWQSLF